MSTKPYGAVLPTAEYVTLSALIVMSCLSFFTNLLLLIAICRSLYKHIKLYFYLLLNIVLVDFTVSFLAVFLLPSYVSHLATPPRCIIFIDFGLCGFIGEDWCKMSYGIMICLYSYIPWITLASLIFRWYIIRYNHPNSPHGFVIFLLVTAVPTIFQLYCSLSTSNNNDLHVPTEALLAELYPDWDFTNITTYAMTSSTDWRVSWVGYFSRCPVYAIIPISLIIRWDTMRMLKKVTVFSTATRQLHRSFIHALTLQTCLLPINVAKSLIFSLGPNLGITDLYWGHLEFIIVEIIPFANACSHIYFVTAYRTFMLSIWRRIFCKRSHSTPVLDATAIPATHRSSGNNIALGVRRLGLGPGNFANMDGTPYNYNRWSNGQPDNAMFFNEYCVNMLLSAHVFPGGVPMGFRGQWNDIDCATVPKYLVYSHFTVRPNEPSNELPSELPSISTPPNVQPTTALPSETTITGSQSTDMTTATTTTSAVTETTTTTPGCLADYTYNAETNSYYFFDPVPRTWADAEAFCATCAGGHLSSIADMAEYDAVYKYVNEKVGFPFYVNFWIGGSAPMPAGTFTWTDGSPFMFTKWEMNLSPVTGEVCMWMAVSMQADLEGWNYYGCSDINAQRNALCKSPAM